jgi:hypothetical protein
MGCFAVSVCDVRFGERLGEGGVHGVSFQRQAAEVYFSAAGGADGVGQAAGALGH